MKKDKETIMGEIYEEFFPWVNDGISKIQDQYGEPHGEWQCSMELDMEFREAYDKLAECVYKQLVENEIFETDDGSAEIKIVLKNGQVLMYHSDGTLLNKRPSLKGDWDKICNKIKG